MFSRRLHLDLDGILIANHLLGPRGLRLTWMGLWK